MDHQQVHNHVDPVSVCVQEDEFSVSFPFLSPARVCYNIIVTVDKQKIIDKLDKSLSRFNK